MSRQRARRLHGRVACAGALMTLAVTAAQAAGPTAGGAWMRATVPGITVGVAYLSITGGDADDELVAVSCEAAARVEIHETRGEAGVTTMRAVARLPIASHRTVRLAPAGLHLMLVDLRHALSAGSTVPLTLEFARAGRLVVRARVAEPGAMTAPSHD